MDKKTVLAEGFLMKHSVAHSSFLSGIFEWAKRYCVLSGNEFSYYSDETKKELKGTCQIFSDSVVSHSVHSGHGDCLEIDVLAGKVASSSGGASSSSTLSKLVLQVPGSERNKWESAFNEAIRSYKKVAKMNPMVATTNAMMTAWADNNGDLYRSHISSDFKMVIPAYNLSITGFEGVWGVRQSMGASALNPHINEAHFFPEPRKVQTTCSVVSKENGERVQLSKCVFTFDENFDKVVEYFQENLFMKTKA